MQNELTLALIQTTLVWENPIQNRTLFEQKIDGLPDGVELVILPEMFTSGFTMTPKNVAEPMEGETVKWMQELASRKQIAITGSVVIKEGTHFFNRMLFVHPDGTIDTYDKRHTFTLAGEDKVYKAGTERKLIDFKGWKLLPLICYDLRFPVWARNVDGYDAVIYVANWPKPRINAWDALLKARAVENMAYSIGVNRVGMDATGHLYSGHSAVYDVLGNEVTDMKRDRDQVEVVTLSKDHIKKYRDKLRFLNDRDDFSLSV